MNKLVKIRAQVALVSVAVIAILTAIAHLSCIYFGAECYSAQMAPREIVESAIKGTWLAPVGTLLVSLLFILAGLYALSAAQVIRKLPLLSLAIYLLATLCILRGLAFVYAVFYIPEVVTSSNVIASSVWGLCGVLCLYGYRSISAKR